MKDLFILPKAFSYKSLQENKNSRVFEFFGKIYILYIKNNRF